MPSKQKAVPAPVPPSGLALWYLVGCCLPAVATAALTSVSPVPPVRIKYHQPQDYTNFVALYLQVFDHYPTAYGYGKKEVGKRPIRRFCVGVDRPQDLATVVAAGKQLLAASAAPLPRPEFVMLLLGLFAHTGGHGGRIPLFDPSALLLLVPPLVAAALVRLAPRDLELRLVRAVTYCKYTAVLVTPIPELLESGCCQKRFSRIPTRLAAALQ